MSNFETALRKQEHWLDTVLRSIGDAVIVTDQESRVVFLNPVAEQLTGWTQNEAVGRDLVSVFHIVNELTGALAENRVARVIEKGAFAELANHTLLIRRDGMTIPIDDSAAPVYDDSGAIAGVVLIFRDITERRQSERELNRHRQHLEELVEARTAALIFINKQLEQEIAERVHTEKIRQQTEEALAQEQFLMRTLLDNIPDHIYFKDINSRFIRMNKSQADRFGLDDPAQAIGKDDSDFFLDEHARQAYADEQEIIRTGCPIIGTEEKETWPDDSETWVSTTKMPLRDPKGNIIGTFGLSRDITERRRAEEALRQEHSRAQMYLDVAGVMLVALNAEGEITLLNRQGHEVLGYAEGELVGKHWFTTCLPPRIRQEVQADFRRLLAGESESAESYENSVLTRAGEERLVAWHNTVLRDETGRAIGTLSSGEDITDSRQAAEALGRSEATLRSIFRAAPVGIGLVANRVILQVNDWICEMTGYSREELVGQNARILYPTDEDYQYVGQEKYDQIRKRGTGAVETHWRRKDGTIRDILLSSTPLDPDDWSTGITFTALDITAQLLTQEAIRESQQRYQQLVDSMDGIVWERDIQTLQFTFVGPQAERILGYPAERWLNEPTFWPDHLHPDDRTWVLDLAKEATAEKKPHTFECRMIAADGRVVWLRDIVSPVFENDRPVRSRGIMLDVTERKQAEEMREYLLAQIQEQTHHMQQIIDAVPEGVLLLDAAGQVVLANPAAQRDLAVLADAGVGDVLSHMDGMALSDLLTWPEARSWHEIKAGHHTFEAIARPVQITPESTGWVLVIRDMTHEREMQQSLRQQDRLAVIGQLASGVAHDFNNILTAIKGYTQLVLDDLIPGDPIHDDLEEIRRAADRAATLTSQLLIFSHKQTLQPQVLDLNGVIANMEKMLCRLIGENITLNTVLSPSLEHVMADPGQIEQVIMNLCVNARDAMPDGGRLTLRTRNVVLDRAHTRPYLDVEPGTYAMLEVEDTGTGMAEEVKLRLFEPFFTTKDPGRGTGLGLATVWGIVKQGKGHIEVHSELGMGTTFKIYLPRAQAGIAQTVEKQASERAARGQETILLVEDEDMVRNLACRILERQGYTVLVARLPSEALQLGHQHAGEISLLVTDVVMPEMSGPELVEQLAIGAPQMKTLYISGYTDDAIADQGALKSGGDLLSKPFTPAALARKVREALDGLPKE